MKEVITSAIGVLNKDKWIALVCVILLSASEGYQGYETSKVNLSLKETNLTIAAMATQMSEMGKQIAVTSERSLINQNKLVVVQEDMIDFQRKIWADRVALNRMLRTKEDN